MVYVRKFDLDLQGDVEDDPDFWARLEAESARATSSSAATTGFAASGDAQVR